MATAGNRDRTDDLLITNLLVPGIGFIGETRAPVDSFPLLERISVDYRPCRSMQINADSELKKCATIALEKI
jgi:hypothetical protein